MNRDVSKLSESEAKKWRFLSRVPEQDARSPRLQTLSQLLLAAAKRDARRFALLALAVARDWVAYTRDGAQFGGEDIAGFTREPTPNDALDALERGRDDCDAKARLFVALCLAAGLPARMVPLVAGDRLKHVAGEVRVDGAWLHAETTLARACLGDLHTDVPRETNGKWRLT